MEPWASPETEVVAAEPPTIEAAPVPAGEEPATLAPDGAEAAGAQPTAVDAEAVAQTVAERLSEDEALRGDLSDAGFGPILNWATDLAIEAAGRGGGADELSQAARALVRAIVKAAETGDPAPVRGALAAALFTPEQTSRASAALDASRPASAAADERAQALVQALAAATTGGQT